LPWSCATQPTAGGGGNRDHQLTIEEVSLRSRRIGAEISDLEAEEVPTRKVIADGRLLDGRLLDGRRLAETIAETIAEVGKAKIEVAKAKTRETRETREKRERTSFHFQ
jgi:hypothetical protein